MARQKKVLGYTDHLNKLSITMLRKAGFLRTQGYQLRSIRWDETDREIVSVVVNTSDIHPYVLISHNQPSRLIKYKVPLTTIPSNLGKGKLWYFLCPQTNKRCRVLYFNENHFSHRTGLRNHYYFLQTMSHKSRSAIRILKTFKAGEFAVQQLGQKHFKKMYNGRKTKKYLLLKNKIRLAHKYNAQDIELLFLT